MATIEKVMGRKMGEVGIRYCKVHGLFESDTVFFKVRLKLVYIYIYIVNYRGKTTFFKLYFIHY